jgi:hypothetical protein
LHHFCRMEATYGNIHRLIVYSLLGMFLWRRRLTSRSVEEIVHIAKLIMRPMLTFPQAPSPTITSFRLISDILSKVVRDTLGELDSRSRRGSVGMLEEHRQRMIRFNLKLSFNSGALLSIPIAVCACESALPRLNIAFRAKIAHSE